MASNKLPGSTDGWCQGTVVDLGTMAICDTAGPATVGIGDQTGLVSKLNRACRYAASEMGGVAGQKLLAFLTPTNLAIFAGTITTWAAAHAFGAGEAADALILIAGYVFIGWDAYIGLKHFWRFAVGVVKAQGDADLKVAGHELAQAIVTIGIDAVLIWMTHKAATAKRYKPTFEGDVKLKPGTGGTDKYGNVQYSTAGTATDQSLVRYHESVHANLSPKLMAFRELRANLSMAAYQRSAFLRYLEEAMAESYAQLRVNGIKGLPAGIRFPIANGYVTLSAVMQEIAFGTIVVGGTTYYVYVESSD